MTVLQIKCFVRLGVSWQIKQMKKLHNHLRMVWDFAAHWQMCKHVPLATVSCQCHRNDIRQLYPCFSWNHDRRFDVDFMAIHKKHAYVWMLLWLWALAWLPMRERSYVSFYSFRKCVLVCMAMYAFAPSEAWLSIYLCIKFFPIFNAMCTKCCFRDHFSGNEKQIQ